VTGRRGGRVGLLRRERIGDNALVRQPFNPGSSQAQTGVEESL
jgi:hypothetical protein